MIEQINRQLNKLIDVAAVMDLSEGEHLERELMLAKVRAKSANLKNMIDSFQGRVIDESDTTCTIELTDTCAKLDGFLQAIAGEQILETVRTGALGIGRGERVLEL